MKTFIMWAYFNAIICLSIIFNNYSTASIEPNVHNDSNNVSSPLENITYSLNKPTELPPIISTCEPDLIYNLVTQSCVDNETAQRIERRPSCKNITLLPNFVTIENGRLYVTESAGNVSTDHFIVRNDNSVSLCYPLTPKFRACQRWGVYPNEYELTNGGLTLFLTETNITVPAGDFTVNEEKFGVMCVVVTGQSQTYVIDAYATAWLISTVSLFVSLLIYAITNRKLNYQTKTMMCHMLSLFVFYLLLTIRAWGPDFETNLCLGYSVVVHYFFLASFFWINVMAFDIWKNLPRFATKAVSPWKDRRRFVYMSLYAWGLPAVIAVSAVLTDHFAPEENVFRPQFGRLCWFVGIEAKLTFLYGPAAALLGANIMFFVMTVWSLKKLGKDTMLVNKQIHSQLTRMYMKLLIVMGLCWIMEIVSGLVEKDDRYWYFTDIINGLQGFFLFLVYVCKRNVVRDLLKLWVKHVGIGSGLCRKITTSSDRFSSAPSRENSSAHAERGDSESSTSIPTSESRNSPSNEKK
uniref:G-protein coupled receptors family 2 profile 2 domain-containing protein n=1 Tax=Strigamia maritima TaxID=126957 RepID=T1J8X7_STRMM